MIDFWQDLIYMHLAKKHYNRIVNSIGMFLQYQLGVLSNT